MYVYVFFYDYVGVEEVDIGDYVGDYLYCFGIVGDMYVQVDEGGGVDCYQYVGVQVGGVLLVLVFGID